MFRALTRWVKAVGYLLTGQMDSARRTLDTNPHVMGAKYDDIIQEKTNQIHTYKQAVAGLIAQQENKIQKLKSLTDDITKLERLKSGALAKAKKTLTELQASGMSTEEIQQQEAYQVCQNAYHDFTTTESEKQTRVEELEKDIQEYDKRIAEHKVQLTGLLRAVEDIRVEKHDAVADVITAKQETELNEMLAGIAKDGTSEELQRMRQLRQEVKAEARVTQELAGTDTAAQEAEFMEYARKDQASTEFEALLGLAEKTDPGAGSPDSDTKDSSLPE
jgi:phage shock protein A